MRERQLHFVRVTLSECMYLDCILILFTTKQLYALGYCSRFDGLPNTSDRFANDLQPLISSCSGYFAHPFKN